MSLKVEHEIHKRRFSRNAGVGLSLVGLVVIVLILTVVKVRQLDNPIQMERFDHVSRPALETVGGTE